DGKGQHGRKVAPPPVAGKPARAAISDFRARSPTSDASPRMLQLDPDEVAFLNGVEELDHLGVAQQHAAGAGGPADLFLEVRAVDVDVAVEGVDARALVLARLEAFEAEDAGRDERGLPLGVAQLRVQLAGEDAA